MAMTAEIIKLLALEALHRAAPGVKIEFEVTHGDKTFAIEDWTIDYKEQRATIKLDTTKGFLKVPARRVR